MFQITGSVSRISLVGLTIAVGCVFTVEAVLAADVPAEQQQPTGFSIAEGAFQPTFDSLKQYEYPAWFRDAKLGIWAHWGPQAVPMAGDWYARNMYIQDQAQYKHHLEHYGPPASRATRISSRCGRPRSGIRTG